MRLDRTWIERNIPHRGSMCLLDEVLEWDAQHIRCRSATHHLPGNPLRSQGRLGAACGIEYAAQAMAVHGALANGALAIGTLAIGALANGAPADGASGKGASALKGPSEAGFLAGLRNVRLHVPHLDDVEADLICEALLVAGDPGSALYEFALRSEAQRQLLVSGRATVIFDANERLKK
jgi:predicted hotdog family 3-hydroxylacyl-ACP dehydratase